MILPNYQLLNKIHETHKSEIYRAIRNEDNLSVIIKNLKISYPTQEEIIHYKQEYEITRYLHIEGVIKVYDSIINPSHIAIILEDFGAISLIDFLSQQPNQRLSVSQFLPIAIKITKILGNIHQEHIIHKDINPSNIIYNPETEQLKIIDFGISTKLTKENPVFKHPNILEGTLAYISPEQTGRMNRFLDYRTDFYSLGITFYQLLTGQLPYKSNDLLELVHSHIAKIPLLPHEINLEIPLTLSKIIVKLMAKNAEDRYKSAWGIKTDLENCLEQLKNKGSINEFILGENDFSEELHIPQKLYGRATEVEELLAAFARTTTRDEQNNKSPEFILVSGYSGIGKTSLVQEIYKPITEKKGYFISGKFDQLQRHIPYYSIVKALQKLIKQLLRKDEISLQIWKEKLLKALGENGEIIVNLIPELELMIGKQPEVTKLEGIESENRFNLVFQNFIQVFPQAEHPLVIFIDDLQWADLASLKLINLILTEIKPEYLLLIGAYRDNEVSDTHPLIMTIKSLKKMAIPIKEIILQPLQKKDINQLLIDTFYCLSEQAEELGKLIQEKTEGNPFFINELIKDIHQNNLIYFDSEVRHWQWQIEEIKHIKISENVVELLIKKLLNLPKTTQHFLSLAACIGAEFDLTTLAIISQQQSALLFDELKLAIKLGLVIAKSELNTELLINNYQFAHDRFQQAAYSLIKQEEQEIIHLKIGRLLLDKINIQEKKDNIFAIVDHLNKGSILIKDETEKQKLVELNLLVAKKAKDSAAYKSAQEYLIAGLKNTTQKLWLTDHQLMFELYKERIKIEYLTGDFNESENWIALTLKQEISPLEKVEIYNLLIIQYTMQAKYEEAIETGRKALVLLGIDLPKTNLTEVVLTEIKQIEEKIGDRTIDSLLDAQKMTIPEQQMIGKVLTNIDPPAYFSNQELYAVIVVKMTNISLNYGHIPESSKGYVTYGAIINSVTSNYQIGYEFGSLAIKLSEKFNNFYQKCSACLVFAGLLNHWVKPIKYAQEIFDDGYQSGLLSGELRHAGYNLQYKIRYLFYQGINLLEISNLVPDYLKFNQKIKNQWGTDGILSLQLNLFNLLGLTKNIFDFNNGKINESEYIKHCYECNSWAWICTFNIFKAHILYLYEYPEEALQCIQEAGQYLEFIRGHFQLAEYTFYYSLILSVLYDNASPNIQQKYWQQLENNQKQLKIWSESCPENFQHKYLLVQAEMSRLAHHNWEAIELYEQSIASAHKNQFIQDKALANELVSKFWLKQNKQEFAEIYIKKAYNNYQQWGAKRKIKLLKNKYPFLLKKKSLNQKIYLTQTTTNTSSGQLLDLAAIMQASQTIYSEIVLDKLLISLMKIIMENAGAELAYLILEQQGNWFIEAALNTNLNNPIILESLPLENKLPKSIINYVINSLNIVVLDNANSSIDFGQDNYFQENNSKSVMCYPLLNQNQIIGVIYLENNLTTNVFTPERIEILKILSAPAAIAINNAQFYEKISNNQKQLNQFLEAIPIGIAVVNNQGKPYYANQKAIEILQKPVDKEIEISEITKTYQTYIAGTNIIYPSEKLPIIRALKGEKCSADNLEIHHPDKIILLESWSSPIYDAQGNIEFAISAFQDITQRKQAEKILSEYNQTLENEVTERTQELSETIEKLKTAQSQLILSEKMAALGQLVAGIAHEINTPLGAIQAAIKNIEKALAIMLQDIPLLSLKLSLTEQKEFFNFIQKAQENQTKLSTREQRQYKRNLIDILTANNLDSPRQVADILVDIGIYDKITEFLYILQHPEREWLLNLAYNLIRLQSNNKTTIAAIERASKIVFALKSYSREGLSPESNSGACTPRYDDNSIRKSILVTDGINTVLELYHNQIKKGIKVQINYQIENRILGYPDELIQVWTNLIHNSIQAMNGEGNLIINGTENQKYIIVTITDSGIGIPSEIQKRIFEPFFTTKPMGEGSGLGLDIVKKIIDKHQGKITVESVPGETTFTILLPKHIKSELITNNQ